MNIHRTIPRVARLYQTTTQTAARSPSIPFFRSHSSRPRSHPRKPTETKEAQSNLPVLYPHQQTHPQSSSNHSASFSTVPPPPNEPSSSSSTSENNANSDRLPVPAATGPSSPSALALLNAPINPFNTHVFFKGLETAFPAPIARIIMKSTRAILVDRIRKTKRDALDSKDFDNQAYLFRAALSELRTDLTMRTREESAAIRTRIAGIRKDVDVLEAKMKEDIGALKHEIQMDMNNRKAETRSEGKLRELAIEDLHHRIIVRTGDLRTDIEQAKWDNTRRGVAVILTFVAFVIISMELAPKAPPPPPPKPANPTVQLVPLPDIREQEALTEA